MSESEDPSMVDTQTLKNSISDAIHNAKREERVFNTMEAMSDLLSKAKSRAFWDGFWLAIAVNFALTAAHFLGAHHL